MLRHPELQAAGLPHLGSAGLQAPALQAEIHLRLSGGSRHGLQNDADGALLPLQLERGDYRGRAAV